MKVGIDISSMNSMSKGRGIGFYTDYLIKSLKEYTNVEVSVIDSREPIADSGQLDLIHYPFFDFFKPTLKVSNTPTVVTIHDVIPLLFAKHYPPGLKGQINLLRQRMALGKVKAIITDSKTSTKDVKQVFSIKQDKVFTVYLDCGDEFKHLKTISDVTQKYHIPKKYVLYSGSVNWNKNLLNQTKAALEADMDIVYIGKGFESRENLDHPEMKSFKDFLNTYSKHPKVHILGFVPGDDLIGLINQAQAVLYVSHYEGFGLPILEAQSCKTPVITGNTSSMVEVAGEGALLVDPTNTKEIKKAILELGEDTKKVEQLVQKGVANLKRFSWEKTAQETAEVYKYALSQK